MIQGPRATGRDLRDFLTLLLGTAPAPFKLMNCSFLEFVFSAVDRGHLKSRKNETVRMGDKGTWATLSQGPRPPGEERLAGSPDPVGPLQRPQPHCWGLPGRRLL